MIALISVPHQFPASIHWYRDRADLERAARERDWDTDREEPADFAEAVRDLADDWNNWLLVESADDIAAVENYAGHQAHRVRALAEELRQEFEVRA